MKMGIGKSKALCEKCGRKKLSEVKEANVENPRQGRILYEGRLNV